MFIQASWRALITVMQINGRPEISGLRSVEDLGHSIFRNAKSRMKSTLLGRHLVKP